MFCFRNGDEHLCPHRRMSACGRSPIFVSAIEEYQLRIPDKAILCFGSRFRRAITRSGLCTDTRPSWKEKWKWLTTKRLTTKRKRTRRALILPVLSWLLAFSSLLVSAQLVSAHRFRAKLNSKPGTRLDRAEQQQVRSDFIDDTCDEEIVEYEFKCFSGGCSATWYEQFCDIGGDQGNYCYAGYGLCCGEEKQTFNLACIPSGDVSGQSRKPRGQDPSISDAALLYVPDRCSQSRRYGIVQLDGGGIPIVLKPSKSSAGGL